jgi:hypothetical protein
LAARPAASNWTALSGITCQGGGATVTDANLDAAPRFYCLGVNLP